MKRLDNGVAVYTVEIFGDDNLKNLNGFKTGVFGDDDLEISKITYYHRTFLVIENDECASICAEWDGIKFEYFPFFMNEIRNKKREHKWTMAFKQLIKKYKLINPKVAVDAAAPMDFCAGPDWFYFPNGMS